MANPGAAGASGRGQRCRIMEGSALTCLQQLPCLPAGASAFRSSSWCQLVCRKKCWQQGMVQGMELGAFIEELPHAGCALCVCVCIRNEVEATGNVKSAPVVDPDTGNLSVLSQMEAADENSSF